MPFAPPAPTVAALRTEAAAWRSLLRIAPWAIGAQGLRVLLLASQAATYAALRRWFKAAWHASLNHQPTPPLPSNAVPNAPAAQSVADLALLGLGVVGVVAWIWFITSAIRVAREAGYPNRIAPALSLIHI